HALLFEPVPFAEHGVGLAHAGRGAEVNLEPAAFLAADQVQELLRSGAGGFGDGHGRSMLRRIGQSEGRSPSRARLRSRTFTRGGAPRIAPDRSVCASMNARTRSSGNLRAAATRPS